MTVTHDSAAELSALLASAKRHLPAAQVVVVDSGSSDDSLDVARRHGAETIELENVGYGRAANAGRRGGDAARHGRPQPRRRAARLLARRTRGRAARGRTRPSGSWFRPSCCPTAAARTSRSTSPATLPLAIAALVPPALLPRRLRPALDPWRADGPRRVGMAGRRLHRRAHRDTAAAGTVRSGDLSLRRGPRPRPAGHGRGDRDLVLAARARPPPQGALDEPRVRRRAVRAARAAGGGP